MTTVHRHVIGFTDNKMSGVIYSDNPEHQEVPQAQAQRASQIKRTSLLQQDSIIAGYQAIMRIVEIPPGAREIKQTHPGPLAVYVLEGFLTLEHESRPTATFKAGDAVLIEAGKIYQGINMGNVPVKVVGTLIAEKGKPPTASAP